MSHNMALVHWKLLCGHCQNILKWQGTLTLWKNGLWHVFSLNLFQAFVKHNFLTIFGKRYSHLEVTTKLFRAPKPALQETPLVVSNDDIFNYYFISLNKTPWNPSHESRSTHRSTPLASLVHLKFQLFGCNEHSKSWCSCVVSWCFILSLYLGFWTWE